MNPQYRGLNRNGRTPKSGIGPHIVARKRAGGRTVYQMAARGAHDSRVYLGIFPTEAEARAAYDLYAATGERPFLAEKGAKPGSKQTKRRENVSARPSFSSPVKATAQSWKEVFNTRLKT